MTSAEVVRRATASQGGALGPGWRTRTHLRHPVQRSTERLGERFPQHYHEPYYPTYLSEDFPAVARRCGLAHRRDTKAFLSKVMVFDKKAG